MEQQWLLIGALVAGGGSIIAWIKFWMDQGAVRIEAKQAINSAATVHNEYTLLKSELQDLRVEVARDYASNISLVHMEERLGIGLTDMKKEMRGLNDRLDRFLERTSSAN